MRAVLVTLSLLLVASVARGEGPSLDAPGAKKVTVRSEILRGWYSGGGINYSTANITRTMRQAADVRLVEARNNTDSAGWRIGWALRIIHDVEGEQSLDYRLARAKLSPADRRLSAQAGQGKQVSPDELNEVLGFGFVVGMPNRAFFKDYLPSLAELGIEDSAALGVLQIKPEAAAALTKALAGLRAYWEKKTETERAALLAGWGSVP